MAGGLPSLPSDALANYTFAIEIGGVEIAQFQEVSGISSELDVIELKENTADGKLVIHKAPGAIKPPTLTLKRAKNSSKALWDWHEAMILGNVSSGRKEGSIVLKSYDGTEWPATTSRARGSRARGRHAQGGCQRGAARDRHDRHRGDRAGVR